MRFFKFIIFFILVAFSRPSQAQDVEYPKYRQYFVTTPKGVRISVNDPKYSKAQKSCKTPCKLTLHLSPDLSITATKKGYVTRTTKTSIYPAGVIYKEPYMTTNWGKYRVGKEAVTLTLLTLEQQKEKDIADEKEHLRVLEYETALNSKNSVDCSNALDADNLSDRSISIKVKPPKFSHRAKTGGTCKLNYNLNAEGKVRDIRTQFCTNKPFELEARKSLANARVLIDHKGKETKAICGMLQKFKFVQ